MYSDLFLFINYFFIKHVKTSIRKTYLDPVKPHFYTVKVEFTEVYIIFPYFYSKTEAVLTSTLNLYFEQKYEKYQNFSLKTFGLWLQNFQCI